MNDKPQTVNDYPKLAPCPVCGKTEGLTDLQTPGSDPNARHLFCYSWQGGCDKYDGPSGIGLIGAIVAHNNAQRSKPAWGPDASTPMVEQRRMLQTIANLLIEFRYEIAADDLLRTMQARGVILS